MALGFLREPLHHRAFEPSLPIPDTKLPAPATPKYPFASQRPRLCWRRPKHRLSSLPGHGDQLWGHTVQLGWRPDHRAFRAFGDIIHLLCRTAVLHASNGQAVALVPCFLPPKQGIHITFRADGDLQLGRFHPDLLHSNLFSVYPG